MAIPDVSSLFLPLLRLTRDGSDHVLTELRHQLAAELHLSDGDLAERIAGGQSKFVNRVSWAAVHLTRVGALQRIGPGVFRITAHGQELLAHHPDGLRLDEALESAPGTVERNGGRSETGLTTPEERLASSYEALRLALAEEVLAATRQCTPAFFERLVVDLLLAMGYGGPNGEGGRAVGRAGDGGIDGIIEKDKLGLETVYVQAKKWEGTVGRPTVQAFAGSLEGHRAHKGVMITTSEFSLEARDYVHTIGKKIVLINGQKLAELMIEHGIGVTDGPVYQIQKLDENYFAGV